MASLETDKESKENLLENLNEHEMETEINRHRRRFVRLWSCGLECSDWIRTVAVGFRARI